MKEFKTTEECPHCGTEQEIFNQIAGNCPNCGNILVACSVCTVYLDGSNDTCHGCVNGSKFKLAEEKEYNIEVCRIGYGFKTITVTANSQNEAEEFALDEAGDHEYSEKTADYVLPDATSNKEESTSTKQTLINKVIEDLKTGFSVGDYTVLDELLQFIPTKILEGSLPEEE